ncbi:MAG TPA: carboxymuconolactone decarboxylase family protein [Alphaproteobacteria bacterium]|nr:carboxymuconolactone decarboxylase family protein [Alphaproteobacteria bacterium]
MSIENIKNAMPDYAKDIKLNLSSLANDETLNKQQLWGTFVASALAGRNEYVISEIIAEASEHLPGEAMEGAKAAAAIMGMNNVYYRFVHLAANKEYQTMQAKLRMNVIGNPGVEKDDFELWSLAVSAINACGMCIDAHEQQLLKHGMSKEQIQTAVRIAAVVHAASAIMDGEAAMASSKMQKAA